jgi:hypothetical protein
MTGLFKRSASEQIFFETHPLEPDEVITDTWVAAIALGGIGSKHGGNLVLTNQRILFEPLKIPSFAPGAKYLIPFAEKQGSANLSEILRAEAVPGHTPMLRLISKRSAVADFLIMASRWTLIWLSKNKKVRDEAVETINRALNQASGRDAPRAA